MLRIAAAVMIVLGGLTACSSTATGANASLDVTIRGSQITPNAERIPLGVGKTFTLTVDTDRDATIHVHSTPEQEYDVTPGTTLHPDRDRQAGHGGDRGAPEQHRDRHAGGPVSALAADRTLGASGIAVPRLGIGCNAFGARIDEERTAAVVDRALDLGVSFFDTADVYGSGQSEELLGKALEGRRDRAVVATKFGMDFAGSEPSWGRPGSATYVRAAVESSLGRLRTDHIDLYQLHQPDPETPSRRPSTALEELVSEG